MDAYSIEGWKEFFVAGTGAAAALTGLVFVALSINLTRILALPGLPARAAGALAVMTQAMILCLLGLVPQPTDAFAVEILVVALIGGFAGLRTLSRKPSGDGPTALQVLTQAVIVIVTALSLLIASASLSFDAGGGLYWLVAGLLLLLLNGIVNAWVLLVEIQR